jgi:hypothetical protein
MLNRYFMTNFIQHKRSADIWCGIYMDWYDGMYRVMRIVI